MVKTVVLRLGAKILILYPGRSMGIQIQLSLAALI